MSTQSVDVARGVAAPARDWTGWPAAWGIALAWFLVALPLVGRSEWEDDMENLTVATAVEIRWTGRVMAPTLQGVTRLNKPPLMPWLTAACISEGTVRDLSSRDAGVREAARARLALEARVPAHAMSALLIVAVYGLGRAIGTRRGGVLAAVAGATMFLFVRYMRFETFDAPLALFTAIAQLCLAYWVFRGRAWVGSVGGGLALGLGLLSKGPIILLFAVAPVLVFLPMRAWWRRRRRRRIRRSSRRRTGTTGRSRRPGGAGRCCCRCSCWRR